MTRPLLDLSGKINTGSVEIFQTVADVAAALDIPFFVIGATARDIVLEFGYGISPSRATRDIDLGVKVADWQQFEELSEALVASGKFRKSSATQRFFYTDNCPLDIVPFGPISQNDISIKWPPRQEVEMNILGFEESFSHALLVKLRHDLEIHFASPVGWALLKIVSWGERDAGERVKDALDLGLILRNYAEAGNEERLYGIEAAMLEQEEYDLQMAGARLLGRDICKISHPESLKKIVAILDQETGEQDRYRLATEMREGHIGESEKFEHNLQLLEKLKQGIIEKSR